MPKKLRLISVRITIFLILVVMMVSCASDDSSSTRWKFAYMSDNKDATADSGVNMATVGRFAEDMQDQGVSLVLVGGDLIDGRGLDVTGLNAQYAKWIEAMAPVYNASIPVYAVPGNHEYWGDSAESCVTAWNESIVPVLPPGRTDNADYAGREYSFTFNNALFIGLDQNQFGSSMPDYYRGNDVAWVKEQLAGHDAITYPHVIVFGHMPQFMLQWGWSDVNKANREEFWNALESVNSKMYFTGHSHTYALGEATTISGGHSIYQILAGSAGAGFEPEGWTGVYYESDRVTPVDSNNAYEGYALVTITGENVRMDWRYYDSATGTFKSRAGFGYNQ